MLSVAGVRFLARREAAGRFTLLGPGRARVGTCDSLDECEARAWDVARGRGLA